MTEVTNASENDRLSIASLKSKHSRILYSQGSKRPN